MWKRFPKRNDEWRGRKINGVNESVCPRNEMKLIEEILCKKKYNWLVPDVIHIDCVFIFKAVMNQKPKLKSKLIYSMRELDEANALRKWKLNFEKKKCFSEKRINTKKYWIHFAVLFFKKNYSDEKRRTTE